jgi:hypothetical protein
MFIQESRENFAHLIKGVRFELQGAGSDDLLIYRAAPLWCYLMRHCIKEVLYCKLSFHLAKPVSFSAHVEVLPLPEPLLWSNSALLRSREMLSVF